MTINADSQPVQPRLEEVAEEQEEQLAQAPVADVEQSVVAVADIEMAGSEDSSTSRLVKRASKAALIAGGLGAAVALSAGAIKGADHGSRDLLKNTKAIDVATIGHDAFQDLRDISGGLVAAGALGTLALGVTGLGRTKLHIAFKGVAPNSHNTAQRIVAGAVLPMAGIAALSTMFTIEDSLANTTTPIITEIDQGARAAAPLAGGQVMWSLEPGTNHFMDDSHINRTDATRIESQVISHKLPGISGSVAYNRDLVTIPTPHNKDQQGMTITLQVNDAQTARVLPKVEPGAIAKEVDGHPILAPNQMITDVNEGYKVGDVVKIRDHEFTVAGLTADRQSIINRLVAYTGSPTETNPTDFYGLISVVKSPEDLTKLYRELHIDLENQTTPEFIASNEEAWTHNGTPLLVIMVGSTLLFAAVTYKNVQRNENERDKSILATMRAIGFKKKDMTQMLAARISINTAKGVIPAYILSEVAINFVAGNQTGFSGEVNWPTVLASTAVVGATQMAGLIKRPRRQESLAEQMKQK